MIQNYKKQRLGHDIAALPDHIVGRAEYLKDYFDRNAYEVLEESVNPLIDELGSADGAKNIGAAAFPGIPAGTVQSQLEGLKGLMDHAVWGVPESCDTAALKSGAVTWEKLSGEVTNRLNEAVYPAECAVCEGGFALTGEFPTTPCTVRFTAPAAFVKGDALRVGGVPYALSMVNGKALGNNAWVAGAVVCLQLDPAGKKAFFSGGGADLSFVTAGAAQIMAGFVGANVEGEPVAGTRTLQMFTAPVTNAYQSNNKLYAVFPMPDFTPDVIIMNAAFTRVSGSYRQGYSATGFVDYVNRLAIRAVGLGASGVDVFDYTDPPRSPVFGGSFEQNPWMNSRNEATVTLRAADSNFGTSYQLDDLIGRIYAWKL